MYCTTAVIDRKVWLKVGLLETSETAEPNIRQKNKEKEKEHREEVDVVIVSNFNYRGGAVE